MSFVNDSTIKVIIRTPTSERAGQREEESNFFPPAELSIRFDFIEPTFGTVVNSFWYDYEIPEAQLDLEKVECKENNLPTDDCTICKNSYKVGEYSVKTACNHVFHFDCLAQWSKINPVCPFCRTNLPVRDLEYIPNDY
jgi:hypothetical protein